jgi:hypothetical protein
MALARLSTKVESRHDSIYSSVAGSDIPMGIPHFLDRQWTSSGDHCREQVGTDE